MLIITLFLLREAYHFYLYALDVKMNIDRVLSAGAIYKQQILEESHLHMEWYIDKRKPPLQLGAIEGLSQKVTNVEDNSHDNGNYAFEQLKQFCRVSIDHPGCNDLSPAAMDQLLDYSDPLHDTKPIPKKVLIGLGYYQSHENQVQTVMKDTRYDVIESKKTGPNIKIRIAEYYKGKLSSGGASFKAKVSSTKLLTSCSISDHFNGYYDILCHFPDQCGTVDITLMFVNFSAFWGQNLLPQNKNVFNREICSDKLPDSGWSENEVHYCSPSEVQLSDANKTYWIKPEISQISEWRLASGECIVRHLVTEKLEKCLTKFNQVALRGDSHMRFDFFYLLYLLDKIPDYVIQKFRDKMTIDKVNFHWTVFEDDLIERLKDLQDDEIFLKATPAKPNILILGVGAWAFRYRRAVDHISGILDVLDYIAVFKKTEVGKNTHIYWFNTTPNREEGEQASGVLASKHRNSFTSAAANKWFTPKMAALGITVFDKYSIVYPRTDSTVCGGHFLCIENGKYTPLGLGTYMYPPFVHGHVGAAAMDFFLHSLCGDTIL